MQPITNHPECGDPICGPPKMHILLSSPYFSGKADLICLPIAKMDDQFKKLQAELRLSAWAVVMHWSVTAS